MTNTMGGTNLHTPPSIFRHMMGQHSSQEQENPWMQLPQVPAMTMPWSIPSIHKPELIRFQAERPTTSSAYMRCIKRKLEAPDLYEPHQTKQFITEEKMAAHFQDLHISNNYQSQNPTPSTSSAIDDIAQINENSLDLDMEGASNILDIQTARNPEPKLIISEELKRLQQEPILPQSLVSKLERPSMALVLWHPPPKRQLRISGQVSQPQSTPTTSDDNNNSDNNNNNNNNNNSNNNNNEAMPDLNLMPSTSASTSLEPMDL
ncbi:probable myosin light chain kinase DDB_G0279831 [Prorops nasuta]|uniref:probable myosin light chain kinase DDB_G0279831 n=1 Tax=Prorops nasuta TaxID=863751 RepID=UPI0034D010D7